MTAVIAPRVPRLSVIIPTHEVEVYVGEMLRSVLRQRVEEMEVIVVDDHSTDGTVAEVQAIAATDERVRIVAAPERGGALARNHGASLATGQYLIFLDGDDIVPDGALDTLVEALDSSGSDMAVGRYLKFSSTRTWDPTRNWPVYKERVIGTTLHAHPALLRGRPCWNKMVRREFWEREGVEFPNVPRSNDILPVTKAMLRAASIDILPDVVYLYRERPGSGSMTSRAASVASMLSYLEQELACMREVVALGDARVEQLYFALLLEADLWVHVARWVPTTADEADSDLQRRVLDLVAELVRAAPERVMAKLRPERRAYFGLVLAGDLAPLRGLDLRGEIGTGPANADAAAFREVGATIRGIVDVDPVFLPVVARGFLKRVAEPLWSVAADTSDHELGPLAAAVAKAGAALNGDALELVGSNARQLITMAAAQGLEGLRRQAAALARPEPTGTVLKVTSSAARFAVGVAPEADELRLVCVHRDSGREVTGAWTSPQGSVLVTLGIRLGACRELGVWELSVDVRSGADEVRRPLAATERTPELPTDPLASIRLSRVKHPGHHFVLVRGRGVGRRAVGAVARRARRLLGSN